MNNNLSYKLMWIGDEPNPEPAPEPNPEPNPDKTYTQAEFNNHMKGLRVKAEAGQAKLLSEIEALKKRTDMTSQERQELENRLEALRDESLTKEEKLKKDAKRKETEWSSKFEELQMKHTALATKYEDETIKRAITDAAVANDVFSPEQVVAMLRTTTQLVEVLDEQKEPTGRFQPVATFTGVDEDGKEAEEKLPVSEAIKRMKELPEKYGNLFKSNTKSGLGGFSGVKTNTVDIGNMSMEDYARRRKAGKI